MQGKQPQGGFFRFQERHQHEGNGLSSAGVGDNSENYEKVPFYAGTMCVNQVDGSVCGSTPFAFAAANVVSVLVPFLLCALGYARNSKRWRKLCIDKPSQNTTSHNFCQSRQRRKKLSNVSTNVNMNCNARKRLRSLKNGLFRRSRMRRNFFETKAYWADRKKWNPCETKKMAQVARLCY